MRKFLTSDHHFGYESFYHYNSRYGHTMRPHWLDAEDFLTWYIAEFNNVVPKFNSLVYFLGDFAYDYYWAKRALDGLNGERKVLICGNHEVNKDYKSLFDSVEGLVIRKSKFAMSHAGLHPKELEVYDLPVNYHGHLHKEVYNDSRYVNCCVDFNNQVVIETTNKKDKIYYGTQV